MKRKNAGDESTNRLSGHNRLASEQVQRLPQLFAASAGGIALLALVGWQVDTLLLAGQWDSHVPMAPGTALAFLLLGGGLFCHARLPALRLSRLFALAAAGIVSLLSVLVLAQFLTGIDLAVWQALSRTNERIGSTLPGRMSPLTAAAFLLESAALFLLIAPHRRHAPIAAALLAAGATAINAVVLIGYSYGVPLPYTGAIRPVSLPAAIAFVLVGAGQISLAFPGIWAIRARGLASTRAILLRAFLPALLILILVEGWLQVELERFLGLHIALWHSLEALAAGGLIVVITGRIAWRIGAALEQAQAQVRSLAHAR